MEKDLKETKRRIRTGDTVYVISGNHRGQKGEVLSCRGNKIVVQGLNFCTKHVKRSQENPTGTVKFEKGIHVSNLAFYIEGDKPARVKVRTDGEGNKELYYLQDGKSITYRSIKQKQS